MVDIGVFIDLIGLVLFFVGVCILSGFIILVFLFWNSGIGGSWLLGVGDEKVEKFMLVKVGFLVMLFVFELWLIVEKIDFLWRCFGLGVGKNFFDCVFYGEVMFLFWFDFGDFLWFDERLICELF